MKKFKIITQRRMANIPVDRLRTYSEMLIERCPQYFQGFQDMDTYRIFFPFIAREHKERIRLFRYQIIYTLRELFSERACVVDLALIFRFKNYSTIVKMLQTMPAEHIAMTLPLKDELRSISNSLDSIHSEHQKESHTMVSGMVNGQEWKCFIPNQYLEFATKIFNALREEIGIEREVLCAQGRGTPDFILARDVFVFVFCRRYPDVTEKFLACILGRSSHSSISHSFTRQLNYQGPVTQRSSETIRFLGLVEEIKKKVA